MKLTWVKFHLDFFDDPRVKVIETMPESNTMIAIWFKLVALVGGQNTGGRFVLRTGRKESEMPLNEEIIAGIVNESLTTVRLALHTYERLGMIEAVDGVYVISDWDRIVDEERLRRLEARRGGQAAGSRPAEEKPGAGGPRILRRPSGRLAGADRTGDGRAPQLGPALPQDLPWAARPRGCPSRGAHPCPKRCPLGRPNGLPTLPMGHPTGHPCGHPGNP